MNTQMIARLANQQANQNQTEIPKREVRRRQLEEANRVNAETLEENDELKAVNEQLTSGLNNANAEIASLQREANRDAAFINRLKAERDVALRWRLYWEAQFAAVKSVTENAIANAPPAEEAIEAARKADAEFQPWPNVDKDNRDGGED